MSDRLKNSRHTGKTYRQTDIKITLDTNMIGYLYLLSSQENVSIDEFLHAKKDLTREQLHILKMIVECDFEGFQFYTTPQIIREVVACAKLKKDDGIVKFLEKICKIRIPQGREAKENYARVIVSLMQEYLRKDIPLNDETRALQSAVATEIKQGEENFADAKIVAENTILNGCPLVTRNEKHLVSMPVKRRNNFRSLAILDKNKRFFQSNATTLPNHRITRNLKNEHSTTFRINDIFELSD